VAPCKAALVVAALIEVPQVSATRALAVATSRAQVMMLAKQQDYRAAH
jgi:hypothetical protein